MNKEDQLQSLDESRSKGEISYDLYVIQRDRLINEIARKCDFCVTPGDQYCVCKEGGYKKYIY